MEKMYPISIETLFLYKFINYENINTLIICFFRTGFNLMWKEKMCYMSRLGKSEYICRNC